MHVTEHSQQGAGGGGGSEGSSNNNTNGGSNLPFFLAGKKEGSLTIMPKSQAKLHYQLVPIVLGHVWVPKVRVCVFVACHLGRLTH